MNIPAVDGSRIIRVTRDGDWVMFSMIISVEDPQDGICASVYGRFKDGRLVQWTTEPPPCFPTDTSLVELHQTPAPVEGAT